MSAREIDEELRQIQITSEQLATEPTAEDAPYKPLHETTTVAVRLIRSDADAITHLATERGVPVSSLLRAWILAGLRTEQGTTVDATLIQLEQGIGRLRRALG